MARTRGEAVTTLAAGRRPPPLDPIDVVIALALLAILFSLPLWLGP